MSAATIKGVWWRSDAPDRKVHGEIVYGATSGATVDLFGHIYDHFDDRRLKQRFTLHGLTFKNQAVSLFDCVVSNSRVHMPGGRRCVIKSNFGVVGGHFTQVAEIEFKTVRLHLNGLRDWTSTSGIQTRYEEVHRRAIFTCQVPDDISLGRFDNLKGKIEFFQSAAPSGAGLSINEDCHLVLEAEGMARYATFETIFHKFQHFLSLALQRPVYAVQIKGRIDTPKHIVNGCEIFEDFLVIQRLLIQDGSEETLAPQDVLFTLPELGDPLEKVFGCFLSKHDRLKPSMELFLSTVYNPNQSARAKFLTLAQGVEGYHRVSMPGKYLDDETYANGLQQALLHTISTKTEGGFRESLKNKLRHLHEFSLRKRLEALAQKHAPIVGNLLGRPKEFGSEVSELRNQLTHPEPNDCSIKVDNKRLWHLSEKIALLLEVCFLDELGISQDQIREIVRLRSQRARHVHFGSF